MWHGLAGLGTHLQSHRLSIARPACCTDAQDTAGSRHLACYQHWRAPTAAACAHADLCSCRCHNYPLPPAVCLVLQVQKCICPQVKKVVVVKKPCDYGMDCSGSDYSTSQATSMASSSSYP